MQENAGKGGSVSLNWFESNLGVWGALCAKAAIGAAIVLILIFLLLCCIVPMLRRQCEKAMDDHTGVIMKLQGAQMVNIMANGQKDKPHPALQGVLSDPDLFLVPYYMDDTDSDEEDEV